MGRAVPATGCTLGRGEGSPPATRHDVVGRPTADAVVFASIDDTLDVFPCHGIGGMVGMLLTGLLATKAVNAAGNDGWFYGNFDFFLE